MSRYIPLERTCLTHSASSSFQQMKVFGVIKVASLIPTSPPTTLQALCVQHSNALCDCYPLPAVELSQAALGPAAAGGRSSLPPLLSAATAASAFIGRQRRPRFPRWRACVRGAVSSVCDKSQSENLHGGMPLQTQPVAETVRTLSVLTAPVLQELATAGGWRLPRQQLAASPGDSLPPPVHPGPAGKPPPRRR